MRAHLALFVAAFGADPAGPTFDPEEPDVVLLDEYMTETDALPEARQLFLNYTNSTEPSEPSEGIPLVPLAVLGVGGAAVAAIVLMRGGHSYETHDYDSAAESGLLDHPDYEVHYDDGSDEYYE
jgi:hypothetical protein